MIKKAIVFIIIFMQCQVLFCQQQNNFVFTQVKYEGRWDPYPETWQDILEFLTTTTSIKSVLQRRVIQLDSQELFSSPFIVIMGTDKFPVLTDKETEQLRRFLTRGGMVFVEDSSGLRGSSFDSSFRKVIQRVFPDKKLRKLENTHPLFRAYYLLRKIGGRRITNNYIEGIDFSGRTGLIYSQNDLMGAWAKDRLGNYLWECSPGGSDQRFEAQKLTLNLLMYAVTGTYKSDSIHQPYINMKTRR